jgi:Mrp family chromosome partitioning ATPase/uncharacterized protein involved in exopolysaccharide biosynthesis
MSDNDRDYTDYGPSPQPAEDESFGKVLKRVHSLLRGKYLLLIVLAIVLSAPLAYVGFRLGEVTYQSSAQIRVKSWLQPVLSQSEMRGEMPGYDEFMQTQVYLLQSQRTIESAMQDPQWTRFGRGASDQAVLAFRNNLTVFRNGEIIFITFEDPDREIVTAAVKSVVGAFRRMRLEGDSTSVSDTLELLQARQTKLTSEQSGIRARMATLTRPYGTDNLSVLFASKLTSIQAMESTLTQMKMLDSAQQTDRLDQLTAEELEVFDPALGQMLADKRRAEYDLEALRKDFGDRHPEVERATRNLTRLDAEIGFRVNTVRDRFKRGLLGAQTLGGFLNGAQDINARVQSLEADLGKAKEELKTLGEDARQLDTLRGEFEEKSALLAQTLRRIDQINTESAAAERVQIISDGDRPLAAHRDTRVRNAAMGAFGGTSLAAGLIVLIGLLNRKYRSYSDVELSGKQLPLLGVLPIMNPDATPEERANVATCVHRIRTMIQLHRRQEESTVLSVTSPFSGTGKTSFVMALGASYAAAGHRTLLIDCDFIGGGLTDQTDAIARPKLGAILQRRGHLDADQLPIAMQTAAQQSRRLGEACIDLGFITEDQLQHALADQNQAVLGVLDVLEGQPVDECIAKTSLPNLSVLPLGRADSGHSATLTPQGLRRLIEQCRERFDVVLIDTGPVLGSLEALVAAAEADGTLLIVSRGESQSAAWRSIEQLNNLGVNLAGVVYNRANRVDFAAYTSGSASVSGTYRSSPERALSRLQRSQRVGAGSANGRLGMVGEAVVESIANREEPRS